MKKPGLSGNIGVGNVRVMPWGGWGGCRVKLRSVVVRKKLVLNPASIQPLSRYLLTTTYVRLSRCGTTTMTKRKLCAEFTLLLGEKDTE